MNLIDEIRELSNINEGRQPQSKKKIVQLIEKNFSPLKGYRGKKGEVTVSPTEFKSSFLRQYDFAAEVPKRFFDPKGKIKVKNIDDAEVLEIEIKKYIKLLFDEADLFYKTVEVSVYHGNKVHKPSFECSIVA